MQTFARDQGKIRIILYRKYIMGSQKNFQAFYGNSNVKLQKINHFFKNLKKFLRRFCQTYENNWKFVWTTGWGIATDAIELLLYIPEFSSFHLTFSSKLAGPAPRTPSKNPRMSILILGFLDGVIVHVRGSYKGVITLNATETKFSRKIGNFNLQ